MDDSDLKHHDAEVEMDDKEQDMVKPQILSPEMQENSKADIVDGEKIMTSPS